MEKEARDEELMHLGFTDPGRLRALLLDELRAAGGSVPVAAQRLGVADSVVDDLLVLVGEEDAPAAIRRELVVSLPPSRAFTRWFARSA